MVSVLAPVLPLSPLTAAHWRRVCVERLLGQRQIARIEHGHLGPAGSGAPRILHMMEGTGALWPHLSETFPGARIYAVVPKGRRPSNPMPGVRLIEGDPMVVPLPEGGVDLVVAALGLHKRPPAELAGRIAGALRPGGVFSVIDRRGAVDWAALEAALRGEGLRAVRRAHGLGQVLSVAGLNPVEPRPRSH